MKALKQQQAKIDKDFADAVANPNLKGKACAFFLETCIEVHWRTEIIENEQECFGRLT